ncbi:cryptochrome/photolyase family protein [Erwinia persicina]|uniref:cryptochrome/photolyase family protein n=1 Tax=Erwinia persicina TaxID=55211 RepID=UPI001CA46425|nr:cryptochrome/photolyase family protein [Erwinia persicina]
MCLVLGDQLSWELPSLTELNARRDAVLLFEVIEGARYVPHHPQKIVVICSAMRH